MGSGMGDQSGIALGGITVRTVFSFDGVNAGPYDAPLTIK